MSPHNSNVRLLKVPSELLQLMVLYAILQLKEHATSDSIRMRLRERLDVSATEMDVIVTTHILIRKKHAKMITRNGRGSRRRVVYRVTDVGRYTVQPIANQIAEYESSRDEARQQNRQRG